MIWIIPSVSRTSRPSRVEPRVVYIPRAAERFDHSTPGLAEVPATSLLLNI
jgi:hypothetical protein